MTPRAASRSGSAACCRPFKTASCLTQLPAASQRPPSSGRPPLTVGPLPIPTKPTRIRRSRRKLPRMQSNWTRRPSSVRPIRPIHRLNRRVHRHGRPRRCLRRPHLTRRHPYHRQRHGGTSACPGRCSGRSTAGSAQTMAGTRLRGKSATRSLITSTRLFESRRPTASTAAATIGPTLSNSIWRAERTIRSRALAPACLASVPCFIRRRRRCRCRPPLPHHRLLRARRRTRRHRRFRPSATRPMRPVSCTCEAGCLRHHRPRRRRFPCSGVQLRRRRR
mmetsp:Transcript_1384/g.4214  ORF Transcript_1384/g.4214 Transcript_1384/m.4214 type:complete len:278 (+) Transcript_1384:692-1525(+)